MNKVFIVDRLILSKIIDSGLHDNKIRNCIHYYGVDEFVIVFPECEVVKPISAV